MQSQAHPALPCRENEDPKTSPHLRATAPDRLDALAALLSRADVAKLSPATQLAAATALKILSRVSILPAL